MMPETLAGWPESSGGKFRLLGRAFGCAVQQFRATPNFYTLPARVGSWA